MKSHTLLTVALLVAGLGLYLSLPHIRHAIITQTVAWPAAQATFTVQDMTIESNGGATRLILTCQWVTPTNQYIISITGKDVVYPDGKKFAAGGVSPLYNGSFAVSIYVLTPPSLLSNLTIPISCRDPEHDRDFGIQSLSIRYWPSGYKRQDK